MWILDSQKYGNPDWKKDSGIRGFRLEVVERMKYGENESLDNIIDALVDPSGNGVTAFKLFQCNKCCLQCILISSLAKGTIQTHCIDARRGLGSVAVFNEFHGDLR